MGFLKNLFGKNSRGNDEQAFDDIDKAIILYDKDGNQYSIAKDEYKHSVLRAKFDEVKNDPDKLYDVIVLTLHDGFFEECLKPAIRLMELEPQTERSATILSITLMKTGRFAEAKNVLEDFLNTNGESGVILTNLAKVQAEEGELETSRETLWKALNADPNQENALDWFAAIGRDQFGEAGFYEAIESVSGIRGSWRAQLWLARRLLESKRIDSAIELYRKVLEAEALPHDVYMMISGDLGNSGYLIQMIDLLSPNYDPDEHGVMAGLNLIQALNNIGDKQRALEICHSIEKLNRYDIEQVLKDWRAELDQS